MPKLREPPENKAKRKIIANIRYYCTLKNLSLQDQRIAMHISEPTYFRRMNNPGDFRLEELIRLAKKLGVSLSALLGDTREEAG